MNRSKNITQTLGSTVGVAVIILSLVASYFIYHNVLGHPDNFIGGDPANEPVEGNYLGVIYKGSSTNVEVLRSVHPQLDNEAIRVMQSMPAWVPGQQNQQPVRVRFNLPVKFVLK